MEYPGSHFTRPWRLALLIFFIAAFCVIAPLVLFTTAGYRIDWNNRWFSFRGTGSLSIDIRPTNAAVYLNGIRLAGSMPYRLNALTPDKPYTLSITSPGYFNWQKDITVRPNETYYLKDIAMLKKTDPVILTTGTIPYISIAPTGQSLVYTLSNTTTELWAQSTLSPDSKILLVHFLPQTNISVTWQQDGTYALIEATEPNKPNEWYTFSTENKKASPLALALSGEITQAEWNKSSEPELYVSVSSTLVTYRPKSGSIVPVGILTTPLWHVDQGHILTLSESTSTQNWTLVSDTFGFPTIIATLSSEELANTEHGAWRIAANINNTVLLTRSGSDVVKLITPKNNYTIRATQFLVSPFNNWLILWDDTEIWTYSSGEEPILLNRTGEKLKTIVPIDQYNTLALLWEKNTTVLYPYYLISHDFLPAVTSLVADSANHELYFSGTIKNVTGLWQLAY